MYLYKSNTEYFVELIRKCILFCYFWPFVMHIDAQAQWAADIDVRTYVSIRGVRRKAIRYATSIEDRVSFYCERM